MPRKRYNDLDYIRSVIKKTIDGSIPYIAKHNAFLIRDEDWNDLVEIISPSMRKINLLLEKRDRGEPLDENEIKEALDFPEDEHAYQPCECGEDCGYLNVKDAGECWGEVQQVDEEYNEETGDCMKIHVCEGHEDYYRGKPYIPKPKKG